MTQLAKKPTSTAQLRVVDQAEREPEQPEITPADGDGEDGDTLEVADRFALIIAAQEISAQLMETTGAVPSKTVIEIAEEWRAWIEA